MTEVVSVGAALAARMKDANVVEGRVFQSGKAARFREKGTLPYVTWLYPISETIALEGDCETLAESNLGQVDLWQDMGSEDETLARTLKGVINAAALNGGDPTSVQRVYRCRVVDVQRIDDPEPGLVHHAFTVRFVCVP